MIFYILSALIVNAAVLDKYKEYIRVITRMILIIIMISPVIQFFSGKVNVKDTMKKIYKDYTATYNKTYSRIDEFSYTQEDVVEQVIKRKVKEVLNEYNITSRNVEVITDSKKVHSNNHDDNKDIVTALSIDIESGKLKKTDMELFKQNISSETGIDYDRIHIK